MEKEKYTIQSLDQGQLGLWVLNLEVSLMSILETSPLGQERMPLFLNSVFTKIAKVKVGHIDQSIRNMEISEIDQN